MFRVRSGTSNHPRSSGGGSTEASPSSSSRRSPPAAAAASSPSLSSSPSLMAAAAAASGAAQLNTSTDSNLDDDPNSSIITKVRSRVSSIIPDALSKWFSPAPMKRQRENDNSSDNVTNSSGRNGNLLAHRSSGYGSGLSQPDPARDEEDEEDAPPIQKRKRLEERFNTSLGDFNEDLNARPGPSGLNISAIDRRSSLPADAQLRAGFRNTFSSSTPSTSPQGAAYRHQQQQQQRTSLVGLTNRTAAPFNFGASTSTAAAPIIEEQDVPCDEEDEEGENSFSTSIRHRRSIREVSGRKRLNIPAMGAAVDRSISEPPAPIFSGRTIFGHSSRLLSGGPPARLQPYSDEDLGEDDPEGDGAGVVLSNGNLNESASESSSVSNLNLSQSEQQHHGSGESRRLSGFMGNNRSKRMKVGGSTGDLCFSSHLETEKSLFSAKNSGRAGRPAFNASLYGSSSSLGSSTNSSLFANSPFYSGRTMYGGASAYSARRDIRQKALRVPVQMRPSSSLSNFSSSNTSLASDTSALSNTAKRILEIMNQCSGPLSEARKLGSSLSLNSTLASSTAKIPGLVQARKRFNEEDLNINRSIRMSSPRTPYSRPQSGLGSTASSTSLVSSSNKPPTAELQIPSMSQLLQMKRLQTNTESVRRLATESSGVSSSILNEPTEYKLPGATTGTSEATDDSNNNKHTAKIRSKLHRVREESAAERNNAAPIPQVNLPEVVLSGLKSVPKFDIKLPVAASSNNGGIDSFKSTIRTGSSLKTATNSSNAAGIGSSSGKQTLIPNAGSAYKFSAPTKVTCSGSDNVAPSKAHNNFKFSNPELLGSRSNAATIPTPKLGGFQFNPDTAKPKLSSPAPVEPVKSPTKAPLPLKSGSCLDALKGPIVPELKSGSCLQALASSPLKPLSAAPTSGFGNAFKLTGSNKWECEACMVRNDPEKAKCVACETPKPGAKPAAAAPATAIPSFGASVSKTSTPTPDAGFKALMSQQSARWECSDCMTRNDADKLKCVCCEKAKPGAAPAAAVAAAVPATIKSMFAATSSSDQGFKALVAQQSAGKWECSACMTRNEATRSKCACCEQAKPGSTPPDAPSFSFGSKPAAASTGSGFSFGVPAKDAAPSAGGFTFGSKAASSTETPKGGFTFGSGPAATTGSGTEDKAKFSFGSGSSTTTTTAAAPVTTGFSFGVKPAAPVSDTTDSSKTSEKKEEPTKPTTTGFGSTGFAFGSSATKSEAPAASTGFSFGTLKSSPANDTTSKSSGFTFGGASNSPSSTSTSSSAATVIAADATKKPAAATSSTVTFGSLAAAGATSTSTAASTTPSSTFSFGSPSTKSIVAGVTTGTPDNSKPAVSTGMFSFGTPKSLATTPGESKNSASSTTSTVTSAAGAGATPSVPIFGGAQKPAAPSITPGFSFGSPASGSTAAATAAAPTTATVAPSFSFGPKPTTDSKPPAPANSSSTTGSSSFVFGQSSAPANKVIPTFGTTAATAATPASATSTEKPVTFGSFGAAPAPSTAPSSSIFGAATATSGFSFGGASAKPAETSSAFSFGGASTAAPAVNSSAFGSPAATSAPKSMFGSPATGATPSFGSFGGASAGVTSQTPTFGASTFGAAAASPASSSAVFGQSATFGSTGTTTSTAAAPAFGAAPSAFGGMSANSVASSNPFGGGQAPTGDEPQPKKAFEFGSSSGGIGQTATPFQFGGPTNNNNNNPESGVKPFSFSANSAPSFNFTAGSNAGQTAAPVAAAQAFQFGAAAPMAQQNPFAATSIPGQTQQQQQRRKIRARRTTPR